MARCIDPTRAKYAKSRGSASGKCKFDSKVDESMIREFLIPIDAVSKFPELANDRLGGSHFGPAGRWMANNPNAFRPLESRPHSAWVKVPASAVGDPEAGVPDRLGGPAGCGCHSPQ